MDRNSIIGLSLIAAILIGYSIWMQPSKAEVEAKKKQRDSIAIVERITEQKEQNERKEQDSLRQASTMLSTVDDSTRVKQLTDELGDFSSAAIADLQFYAIENDLMKIVISNHGASVYSVELKKFKTYDGKPLYLFSGDSTLFGLNFFAQNRSITTTSLYFKYMGDSIVDASKESKNAVFRLYAGDSAYIEYIYTISPGSYMLDFNICMHNMENIIAPNLSNININWETYLPAIEKSTTAEQTHTTVFFKHFQDEVESVKIKSNKDNSMDIPTKIEWIAFKQQFFSSVLIADKPFNDAELSYASQPENSKYLKKMTASINVAYERKGNDSIGLGFYFGPNSYQLLRSYKMDLDELVGVGTSIIGWINKYTIIPVFNWLNNITGNYGLIILLLTIIIKIGLLPLTFRSYMSTAKMKVLKPEVDEINERIPSDKPMERQQAVMAMYKKVGVNPLGGCLPLLLQMPILIAMYKFFPVAIELRQESFLWANDLSSYDSILNLPFNIPFYGSHISLFTILMTVTTILSIRANSSSTSFEQPGMKTMMYIMPIMFMFIFNSLAAGLTYYLVVANVITLGQNFLFSKVINEKELLRKLNENKKKPVKKSKFQERIELAAKNRGIKLPK